uniref:Chorein N-terminal domain-containing protein n=1 Tax=Phytophthora ramorum TaxID=164328 RepID=H3HCM9_PHYRM
MFETLVTGLLTSALGNYIEPKCFSSDKINVAVWSGYVVLTELEVKPEVVADLPAVRLVRGLVGSIELKIPWNRLQSDSVVATVDDVYLLLRTEDDIDAVMRAMDEFTLKKKLLEELLVNKIIDNLELHIRRIHVRVEDHSSGDHPFAMGITIESVHVQSTNSNWQPSYVDTSKSNEPRIFKIVELNHLSVYCNPDCELQRDRPLNFETCSAEQFSSAFSRAIPKRFDERHYHHMQLYPSQQQHHFLLKPIDASARLIVNRDVFDANVPKFEVDVNISEVAFRLEESQYCDILYLASALQIPEHYTKYQRYRKFRPRAAVFDEPADWWKYAITSVQEDLKTKKQQWTWGFMKDRREDRKHYVSLWHQKSHNDEAADESDEREGIGSSPLDHANVPKLSSLEIDFGLEEIERRRSVEDVLFFRYLGDLEVRKFQASRAPPRCWGRLAKFMDTPANLGLWEELEVASFNDILYDEAERGEGAIRWKEEFYDKFSLSIANIHVLLIPYGKTSRVQDDDTGSSGLNYPSVSLPPYLTDIYDEEQEYELVERFNINVTKYFQLVALADRFSVANAEAPKQTRKYSDGDFYSPDDSNDRYEAMRRGSFLSTSALKKFMLNDNESAGPLSAAGALPDDPGDSDGNSSVESDDTWFSITSGNLD